MAELLLFPPTTRCPAPALETPNTLELPDPEARAAALDIHRSWIVEAPAGSGKTGLLIQRFLKLLAHGQVARPADILVLTFTRKADGELRERVLRELTAARSSDPLPSAAKPFDHETRALAQAVLARDRAANWRILDSPAQLNIRTIDSFCADLALSSPLLTSGSARRPPTDDAFPLYRAAAERTLAALGGPDPLLSNAVEHLLLHRDANVQDCLSLIALMLAQREQWGELIPLRPEELDDHHLDTIVRPRLERTLARIVTAGLTRAADALGPGNVTQLAHFAARLSTESGHKGEDNPLAICSNLPGTLPATADFLPHWTAALKLLLTQNCDWRKRLTAADVGLQLQRNAQLWLGDFIEHLKGRERTHPSLKDALEAIRTLPPPCYPGTQWPTVKALSRILAHALIELQRVFSERNQTDFTEIALAARDLLRPGSTQPASPSLEPYDPYDPLDSPTTRLTHLLVDEMQDTSAGQYDLLESLTASWDGASQTVFLVGDPKQSIYAFRQARVERFLRTVDTGCLGQLPLGALRLTANFRSQANLVGQFNATFDHIFPTPANLATNPEANGTSTVPFVAATATREAAQTPAFHWHAFLKPDLDDIPNPTSPAQDQARQIRSHIETFLQNWPTHPASATAQPRPPKIAVLARNRAHLAPILAELRGHNGRAPIPFRAVDVEPLHERPEVLDLVALTRALLHPADRIAWLAVLRSPLCGLNRADLLALTGEGSEAIADATIAHLVHSRTPHLSLEGQGLLHRVWPTLLQAQNTLGRTPLSTHVERTWHTLGGDVPLTPDQHTNALRFLDLLAKLEAGPDPLSLTLLEQNLKKLYAQPFTGDAPVELMTIHKAKGLEWDLVLVPSLERGSGRNPHGLLKWLEFDTPDDEADFLLAPIQPKGEKTSTLSSWLAKSEAERARAEAQRLLYVACTRAREELHLFATVDRKGDGSLCKPTEDSLLRASWPVAEAILTQQLLDTQTDDQASSQVVNQASSNNLVTFPHPSTTLSSRPEAQSAAAERPASPPSDLLTLAAAADPVAPRPISTLHRLPASYNPQSRFTRENGPDLPYPAPSTMPTTAAFTRPEGSFAARAFGNAVHRYLQHLATRLAIPQSLDLARAELPNWLPRLIATLRNEGLPPTLATTEAQRALSTLTATLNHPEGAWLLSPHHNARNEAPLNPSSTNLRADRTFLAGPLPLDDTTNTHLWIVDYKTADPGGRTPADFLKDQKSKYQPQMQAYAKAAEAAGTPPANIVLALYFPLLPALLHWPANDALSLK